MVLEKLRRFVRLKRWRFEIGTSTGIALAAIIGLIVNFNIDMAMFQQQKQSVSTGSWVNHGYENIKAIDKTRIALFESYSQRESVKHLEEKIHALNLLQWDFPSQKKHAAELAEVPPTALLNERFNWALQTLAKMSDAEEVALSERIKNDEKLNSQTLTEALYSNAFDILLILLFVTFFFYERKKALNLQRSLAKTLLDIEKSNHDLQAALAQKKMLFKSTVHDLKNPLGSIRGFAELISDEPDNKDSILKMARVIQKVSNNSLSLIGELLRDNENSEKIEEEFKALDCLRETCAFLAPIAAEKNQKIKLDIRSRDFMLLGRRHQIQDVYFNLIGNALKFSPWSAFIEVECVEDHDFYLIRISDQGPGFSADDFSKLFQPGVKLSAQPTGKESSTGFGLYSARQTLNEFGGHIEVANRQSGGACVCLRIPKRNVNKVVREEKNLSFH